MENKINKIMHLKNGAKYLILNQAIYQGKNYYFVVRVSDDEEDIVDEFQMLSEEVRDGKMYISTVKDPDTLKLLAEYLEAAS